MLRRPSTVLLFRALPTFTTLRRQTETLHLNRSLKETMLVVMSSSGSSSDNKGSNNSPVKHPDDIVTCVFPALSSRWDKNTALTVETLQKDRLTQTAEFNIKIAALRRAAGATLEQPRAVPTVQLPLRLALRLPLRGSTPKERELFMSTDCSSGADDFTKRVDFVFKSFPVLPTRRALLLADAQEQLPELWELDCVKEALRGATSSVWCCNFGQWFVDRRQFDAQRFVLHTSNSKSASAALPPLANAYVSQVEACKSRSCLAMAVTKMDAIACTSQMSHVGLVVQGDAYFEEQGLALAKRGAHAVAKMVTELRRFMPACSAEQFKQADLTGNGLRELVLGPGREVEVVTRPLCLAHGWIAVSLFLLQCFKNSSNSNGSNGSATTTTTKTATTVVVPGANARSLQYAASYFTSKNSNKKSSSQRCSTGATDNDVYTTYESQVEPLHAAAIRRAQATVFDFSAMMPEQQFEMTRPAAFKKSKDAKTSSAASSWVLPSPETMRKALTEYELQQQQEQEQKTANGDEDDVDEDDLLPEPDESGGAAAAAKGVVIEYPLASSSSSSSSSLPNICSLAERNKLAASIFDCLIVVRLVSGSKMGDVLKAEVTTIMNNSSKKTRTFNLHDIDKFRAFVREASSSSSSALFGTKNSSNNNKKPSVLPLRCLALVLDGVTHQDVLWQSLLRPQSAEEMAAAVSAGESATFSWCVMDFAAVLQNVERMKAHGVNVASPTHEEEEEFVVFGDEENNSSSNSSSSKNSGSNKKLDAQVASAVDMAAFEDSEMEAAQRELFQFSPRFSSSSSDEPEYLREYDPSSSSRVTSDDMLDQLVAAVCEDEKSQDSINSNNTKKNPFSLIYSVLVSAGNALCTSPHFDPFLSCCPLLVQAAGVSRDHVLLDHIPDGPFRSRLLTVFHGELPLIETLSRFNSPLAAGCLELEEVDRVSNDLAQIQKAAQRSLERANLNKNNKEEEQSQKKQQQQQQHQFLHARIRHTASATGRLAASNPNIFAIPKDKHVRGAFVSRFGERGLMLEADYSQMEVIVLCALTGDTAMHNDLVNKINFHNKRVTFLKPELNYEQVCDLLKKGDPEVAALRRMAKTFTFQRQYGAGARAIAESTGMELATVQQLMAEESRVYPDVERYFSILARDLAKKKEQYHQQNQQQHHSSSSSSSSSFAAQGSSGSRFIGPSARLEVQLPTGTIIPFDASEITTFATPKLRNYPVQGLAADIMQLSLVELWRRLRGRGDQCVIVNVVHDSVWVDVAPGAVGEVSGIVRSVLEGVSIHALRHVGLDLSGSKFSVDISVGQSLSDMKGI